MSIDIKNKTIAFALSVLLIITIAIPVYSMMDCNMDMSSASSSMNCLTGAVIVPACIGSWTIGNNLLVPAGGSTLILSLLAFFTVALFTTFVPALATNSGGFLSFAANPPPPQREPLVLANSLRN